MNIIMRPTVTSGEIKEEFGINIFECEFTQGVANDSYVTLWLDESQSNDIWEEIQDCKDEYHYVNRLKNELNLINKFRAIGYTDSILVFVSW